MRNYSSQVRRCQTLPTSLGSVILLCFLVTCRPTPASFPTATSWNPPRTPVLPSELQRRVEAREATRIAALTAVPQRTIGPDWTPSPITGPTRVPIAIPTNVLYPAGTGMILEDGMVDLQSKAGSFKNQWYKQLDNGEIRVYAGAEKRAPLQGLIVVSVRMRPQPRSIESYRTALQVGPVRVVSASGDQLTLRADGGTLFYFDLATRQWVTATPGPSPSPMLSPLPSPSP